MAHRAPPQLSPFPPHSLSGAGVQAVEVVLGEVLQLYAAEEEFLVVPTSSLVLALAHVDPTPEGLRRRVVGFMDRAKRERKRNGAWYFAPQVRDGKVFEILARRFGVVNDVKVEGSSLFGGLSLSVALELVNRYVEYGAVVFLVACRGVGSLAEVKGGGLPSSYGRVPMGRLAKEACGEMLKVFVPGRRVPSGGSVWATLPRGTWLAFDMDHTLVEFDTDLVQRIMFDAVLHVLGRDTNKEAETDAVLHRCFARLVQEHKYDPSLSTKFVQIDVERGNLVKARYDGRALVTFHGTRRTAAAEAPPMAAAAATPALAPEDLALHRTIHTFFDRPIAPVFARLVDFLDEEGHPELYGKGFERLNSAFIQAQSTFSSGALQGHGLHAALEDPKRRRKLIRKNPRVKQWLRWLGGEEMGFKVMLVSDAKLEHAELCMTEAFGEDWRELFVVTVVDAKKAGFFMAGGAGGRAGRVQKHGVVDGGCSVGDLVEVLGGGEGGDVVKVYVGDHMQKDVRFPKEHGGWRTVAVLPEVRGGGGLGLGMGLGLGCWPGLGGAAWGHPQPRVGGELSKFGNVLVDDEDGVTPTLLGGVVEKFAWLVVGGVGELVRG